MSFFYTAYGLYVASNQSLPGLVSLQVAPKIDVQINLGVMPLWLDCLPELGLDVDEPQLIIETLKDGAYWRLSYPDGTNFIVERTGSDIWVTWSDGLTLEDIATYVLGPILGFILRLRGITCLHASAVAIGDRAIALVGSSGAGKSTTAAAFAQRGYPILSDDVVALSPQDGTVLVQPAYPRLRLWSTSVEALYGTVDALPCITPNWDKRYLALDQNGYRFQQQPLPLGAIYLLHPYQPDPTAPTIEAISAHRALVDLIANTYANGRLDKAGRAQEFQLLSQLVTQIPVQLVIPHTDLIYLPKLCDIILDNFHSYV